MDEFSKLVEDVEATKVVNAFVVPSFKITIGPQTFSPIQYSSYQVGGIEIEVQCQITHPITGVTVTISPEVAYEKAMERIQPILDRHFQFARRLYFERMKEAHKER